MRINKKYFKVDWGQFKDEIKGKFPPGYKFKKNEIKCLFKKAVGIYKANYKKIKRGEMDGQ